MKKEKGFTLIELLVAILIIGTIFGIVAFMVVNIINDGKKTADKITYSSIKTTSLEYVKEFKTKSDLWSEELSVNNLSTGNEFTCTTIKQLVNKGFLKDELLETETTIKIDDTTSLTLTDDTTIKILRDENMVLFSEIAINDEDCINTKPKVTINATGPSINSWYYDTNSEKMKVVINPTSIGVDLKEYQYTIKDSDTNFSFEETNKEIKEFYFSDKVEELSYGRETEICVTVVNNNDVYSEEACITINVDFTTPTVPTLTASDGKTSNNWHSDVFTLALGGGGNSPSGIYYIYGISMANIEEKATEINVPLTENTTYYVKTCNNVGKCSNVTSYIAKVDNTTPSVPTLTASDGITSNNWHSETFTINVSGGGTSPSGIVYKYGTRSTSVNTNVSNNKISVGNTASTTYYVKACNNAGTCSTNASYVAKVDSTTPSAPTLIASDGIASDDWHNETFTINVSGGGTSPSGIVYKYGTSSTLVNTSVSNNKISVGNTASTTYYVRACNNVGKCSANASYVAKVDNTTPSAPTLTASDGIASGNWHGNTFTINVSGGGTSPSGIVYKYGTSSTSVNTSVSNNKISVGDTVSTTYYVKACNNAGTCSTNASYVAKVDSTIPSAPTLIASDGIASDDWHNETFTINVSGGGTSPSGIVYKYGTSSASVDTDVSNNKISVGNTASTTYYVQACNNVGKCSANASYVAKVDNTTPSAPTLTASDGIASGNWHGNTFTINVSGGGTSPSGIVYKYGTSSTSVDTDVSNNKISVGDTASTTYYVKACNNVGKCSTNASYVAKVDSATPSAPTLTASDGIASGNWHGNTFTINISGGGTSPSEIIYKYGTSSTSVNTNVSNNKISVGNTASTTYYVKACNNAGTCSTNASYVAKIDADAPRINSFTKNTTSNVSSLTLTAKLQDTGSGIVKYKITKESSYVNSGWTNISATTSVVTATSSITENDTYYVWVQDSVGKYAKSSIAISNICGKTFTEYKCSSTGYEQAVYYNSCTGSNEYSNTGNSCESELVCDSSYGSCQPDGYQYRNCYSYYGGIKDTTTQSLACTYNDSVDPAAWGCVYSGSCSEIVSSYGGSWCIHITAGGCANMGYPYQCTCCPVGYCWGVTSLGGGGCIPNTSPKCMYY